MSVKRRSRHLATWSVDAWVPMPSVGTREPRRSPAMAQSSWVDWRKDNVPQDLMELRSCVEKMPLQQRDKLLPLCDRVAHFTRLQGRLVKVAQDAVDQLQL